MGDKQIAPWEKDEWAFAVKGKSAALNYQRTKPAWDQGSLNTAELDEREEQRIKAANYTMKKPWDGDEEDVLVRSMHKSIALPMFLIERILVCRDFITSYACVPSQVTMGMKTMNNHNSIKLSSIVELDSLDHFSLKPFF
jgi:hypothetical protein